MRAADTVATTIRAAAALLRIEARRPAVWLALAVAGGGSPWVPAAAAVPLAAAVGGLLAVAAIGHLPARDRSAVRTASSLLPWVRVSWPVAGGLLAAVWLSLRGNPGAALAAVGVAGSAAVTAAVFAAFVRSAAVEAMAASQTLATIGAGAAAAVAVMVAAGGPPAQAAAMLAAWGLVAGSQLAGQVRDRPMSPRGGRHVGPPAGSGPAMASALAGMVGCYFLAPQLAWAYAVLAVGWFVSLAVPRSTPPAGRPATARLVRSAVGRPTVPASIASVIRLVATTAGLLAWPAVVAVVLAGPEALAAGEPSVALAALAAAAGLTCAAATIVPGRRSAGDLARAVLLSAAAVAAIGAAARASESPASRTLPSLPAAWRPSALQTGVEACRASCQTSQSTQAPRSARRQRETVSSRQASAADTRVFRS